MIIIPAINCKNFECVKERLEKAAKFLPKAWNKRWVQIDIADSKFTKHKTWNNPQNLYELRIKNYKLSKINIETHLMIENPESAINKWIKAGAKRIIVHIERLKNRKIEKLKIKNAEIGLAINPKTPIKKIIPFLNGKKTEFVQILAVNPGKSGQKFQRQVLKKIKFLKKNYPKIKIEIDGGINPKTAELCQKSGADILVVGSYIWKNKNLKQAYKKINAIKIAIRS